MAIRLAAALAAALAVSAAFPAASQEASTNRVGVETAWAIFTEDNPKECWSVSAPTEQVNTKNGRVVAVNRSETLLFVFFRPEAGVKGQITFTGGYPFASGSKVSLDVDGTKYELFTEGEWAWALSAEDDARIIDAMKRGATAVLTGQSSRGTTTKDTFSLLGFTAALEDAASRC